MRKNIRKSVPEAVKREVRQRCGFGCVLCGHPICEIDHITEWSKRQEHKSENLTLLCSNHHAEKTKGLLSKEEVIQASEFPYNVKYGRSSPYNLNLFGNKIDFILGGNTFISEGIEGQVVYFTPILLNRMPLFNFKIEQNKIFFSSIIFNEFNKVVLVINQNEMVMNLENWDIENKGNMFIIREALGKIILKIKFNVPNKIIIDSASLFYNGHKISVEKDIIRINYNQISLTRNTFINVRYGIVI